MINLVEDSRQTIMIPVNPVSVQHGARSVTRGGRTWFFNDKEKVAYMEAIIQNAQDQFQLKMLEGPISLGYRFYIQRPKKLIGKYPEQAIPHFLHTPDLGNLEKSVTDALTKAGLMKNDKQVFKYHFLEKYYAEENVFPRIEVEVIHYKIETES